MVEPYEELALSPEADAALELVLRRDVELASRCLAELQPGEPVAAVCINLTQDESLGLPDLSVARESDWREVAEGVEGPDDWLDVWNPAGYRDEGWVDVPVIEDAEFEQAEERVLAALEDRVIDPYRWVMLRVARRLNAEPPVALVEDGLIYVLNDEFGDDVIEELRFVAPPEKFTRLRARGLIGEPEGPA